MERRGEGYLRRQRELLGAKSGKIGFLEISLGLFRQGCNILD